MYKKFMVLVCCLTAWGCRLEVHENGNDWDDDWHDGTDRDWADSRTDEERAADVCDPYCLELIECGVLGDSAFVACRDLCFNRFEQDELAVTEGNACIQAAHCSATHAEDCEGDPLPGIFEDGSQPPAGQGGAPSERMD